MDIVELTLSYSTAVAGAENEIQVVFACNELVSEGSTVALSGLMGSPRQTGPLVLLYVRTTLLSPPPPPPIYYTLHMVPNPYLVLLNP
jgi:hypothetical protein